MKKILALALCLLMVVSAFGSFAAFADDAAPAAGYTQDDTAKKFSVTTADGLLAVAALINAGAVTPDYNIDIDADIDLTGKEWKSIGTGTATAYKGVVDGKGHVIKALTMTDVATGNNGFIGWAHTGCVVKNLHFEGINMSTTNAYNGAIIGSVAGVVTIENCTTQGRIATTANYAGGLVGRLAGLSYEKIDMKNEDGTPMLDENGAQVKWDYYDVPQLTITNCAVDMTLSADVNYAAGIIGGDSFTQDADDDTTKKTYTVPGVYPKITCTNVFVTGSYTSSKGMASGFMGYFNLVHADLENCFSAAKIEGKSKTQSGSFFARTRKADVSAKNCYSISELPFIGELENLMQMTDPEGKVLDDVTLVRCFALSTENADGSLKAPVLLATLKPIAKPAADATDEEKAIFNDLVIANVDAVPYKIEDVVTYTEAGTIDADEDGLHKCKVEVPGLTYQELLEQADRTAKELFAEGSKQRALVDAYMVAVKCPHTELQEVVDGRYLATNATCSAKMTYYKSCKACGVASTETFEYGDLAPHTWATYWGYNETNHFHACTVCMNAMTDEAPHEYGDWTVEKEATETKEGKEIRTCATCGNVEERAIPKLEPTTPPADETPEPEKKGCGGAIGGASVMLVLAAAGAVVLRKKED